MSNRRGTDDGNIVMNLNRQPRLNPMPKLLSTQVAIGHCRSINGYSTPQQLSGFRHCRLTEAIHTSNAGWREGLDTTQQPNIALTTLHRLHPPEKGTPFCGLYRYVRAQRVWFSAALVINRTWFLHSSLDMGIFLRRSHFFIIIKRKINKSPSQIMFMVI